MAARRYLILTDIHSNLEALDAVLGATRRRKYDGVYCLGDLVGYGASPNPVVTKVRRLPRLEIVRGNHDKVCSGLESGEDFNASAKVSAQWTAAKLKQEHRDFLRGLPMGPKSIGGGVLLCHGSPCHEDAYLFSDFDAYQAFEEADFRVCFFGHTHFPCIYQRDARGIEAWPLKGDLVEVSLRPDARYLINPGSVGQPRDRNPKAAFAEFYPDKPRVVVRRVPYNVERAASRIMRAKLPPNLANRLYAGT